MPRTIINDRQGAGCGFAETGTWLHLPGFGFDDDITYKTTSSGEKTTHTASNLTNVVHNIYVTWVESGNRSSSVPCYANSVFLANINMQSAPTADLTINGRPFKLIGTATAASNTIAVELRHATGGYVISDAVVFQSAGTALPDLTVLYYGDSNLYSSGTGNNLASPISLLLNGSYDVSQIVTAATSQYVTGAAQLAVGGSQYVQADNYSGVNLVVISCGPADILLNPSKATFKTALRNLCDGLGAALGCKILLIQVGDFDYRYSGNSLSEADFLVARTRVREAISEVAAESSYTVSTVVDTTGIAQGVGYDYVHYWSSATMLAAYKQLVADAISAWAGPEISATGNSNNITDGDGSPDTSDHTDFGSVAVGASAISKTYTVANSGGLTLTISSVTVPTGYEIDGASQISGSGTTIATGSSKTLTVNLLTASAGTKAGDVTINSDDASETAFNFAITGTVYSAKEINVVGNGQSIVDGAATPSTGDHTDFGSAQRRSAIVSRVYTVQNTGGETLTISGVAVPAGFQIDASSQIPGSGTTIGAGSNKTLTVNLLTVLVGVKSGDVTITSDDASEAAYNFAIIGIVNADSGRTRSRMTTSISCGI